MQTPLTGHGRRAAGDRRPGVVPARQVRRARSSTPRRAPARGRRVRGLGPDLPRLRPGLLSSQRPGRRRCGCSTCSRPPDARAPGGWSASTGPPGPARPRSPTASRDARPGAPVRAHGRPLEGWRGLPHGRRAARRRCCARSPTGEPGSYRRYDWLAGEYAETVTVPPVPPARARGRRLRGSPASPTWSRCWRGSRRRTTLRMRRGIERDGERVRAALGAVGCRRGRTSPEADAGRADLVIDGTRRRPVSGGAGHRVASRHRARAERGLLGMASDRGALRSGRGRPVGSPPRVRTMLPPSGDQFEIAAAATARS